MKAINNNVYTVQHAHNNIAVKQFVSFGDELSIVMSTVYTAQCDSAGWFCQEAVELERGCGR